MSDPSVAGPELSRRALLKCCAYLVSSLALPATLIPRFAAALERKPRLPVIWLSFQACSGCIESLIRAHAPTLESLLFDVIALDFQHLLQAAAGEAAEHHCRRVMDANPGEYVLIVEGAIPLRAHGAYSSCAGRSGLAQLAEATEGAGAVLAVGSCAAFGGIPKANPNPTDAQGVQGLMLAKRIPDRPLVNLPGCPPLPITLSATLAHMVVFQEFPRLDALRRPRAFYGATLHERCERLGFFQQGQFAERFDDEGARRGWCLFKLGCKGPTTHNGCALYRWNEGVSWPVGSGHPCLGCSEPDCWDGEGLYRPIRANVLAETASR